MFPLNLPAKSALRRAVIRERMPSLLTWSIPTPRGVSIDGSIRSRPRGSTDLTR
jgi:hypothetical protein